MARITDIYLVETLEKNAVAIHARVGVAEIPEFIGAGFVKMEKLLKSRSITPSNTPFLRIAGSDPNALEITVGMEVPSCFGGDGEIEHYTIPGGKKLFCYWAGDNADMSQLYSDMQSYAADSGRDVEDGFYEYYLNGINYGVSNLLTKVVMLLK